MRIINRARRSGKTTMMIHAAYVTGGPIITYSESRKRFILTRAKEQGFDIPVYSFEDIKRIDNSLIDDTERVIEEGQDSFTYLSQNDAFTLWDKMS